MLPCSEIEQKLRQMIEPMPPGSSLMLPVDWLRQELSAARLATPPTGTSDVDFTIAQVAEQIGRKASTVRGWCSSGQLEAYLLMGRDWRVTREALRRFQERQRTSGPRTAATAQRKVDLGAWRTARPRP